MLLLAEAYVSRGFCILIQKIIRQVAIYVRPPETMFHPLPELYLLLYHHLSIPWSLYCTPNLKSQA